VCQNVAKIPKTMSTSFKKYAAFLFSWRKKNLISPAHIRLLVFLHDLCMIPFAWMLTYWLRFNLGEIPPAFIEQALSLLPLIICVQVIYYWLFGLYRGLWRFASLPDLTRIVKVVTMGIISSILLLFLSAHLVGIPRSIFPLYGLLLIVLLGTSRLLYRWLKEYADIPSSDTPTQRVLIIGAGQAGEGLVRDLIRQRQTEYRIVGFVDDKSTKRGQEIHGIRVLGNTQDIPTLVRSHHINLIMIAIPSASSADMRRIVAYCEQSSIPFRTLPSLQDLASGNIQIDALRAVSLEDLLGRDPVSLDWEHIHADIAHKTILVTGGGGSIGSELCRQIARLSPAHLIVIEQNEFNVYALGLEMRQKFPQIDFTGYLLDLTDKTGVCAVLQKHNIDIVFHAAAYKHVPLLENQIRVAVKNNILGTHILVEAASAAQVKKFVLISTDKAVNPTNIMGATKRVAEIFCQNYTHAAGMRCITVRFGNVLGSIGSVVPLFKKQIEAGGPVTVTHPDMTRFFMTIPEATQLILQASVLGKGGEIFILDMGEPVKIQYLAEQMILLAGLLPGRDIAIQYTGLRPGEKLYEELFHAAEPLTVTAHEKIMQASSRQIDPQILTSCLTQMQKACAQNDTAALSACLTQLVPEYTANASKVVVSSK
jgi:FlaA1/EpsC-like NDP-sugar epimerase